MQRIYNNILEEHLKKYNQMIFLAGPRQVGKTTIALNTKTLTSHFLEYNWDKVLDREKILNTTTLINEIPIDVVADKKPIIMFDELHKYKNWKNWIKGFVDQYKDEASIIVTGSGKLDIYRKGGDSLMGRYFLYRIHPLSVSELLYTSLPSKPISMPKKVDTDQFNALFKFGGFPEPFIKQDERFYNRWQTLRKQQTLREDIKDLAQIQELAQLEVLSIILSRQTGQLLNYTKLAVKVRVADQTIRRWINVLESFYYCFTIRPWTTNVSRSLLKEPKLYLWDWSVIEDHGAKVENFIACHLLKAIHFWNDYGFGQYTLHFVRDKDKREVDFLITENNKPWILIEVKSSGKESMSKNLYHFQSQLKAKHIFQVAFDLPYVEKDCFSYNKPMIVSAKAFLSQLI